MKYLTNCIDPICAVSFDVADHYALGLCGPCYELHRLRREGIAVERSPDLRPHNPLYGPQMDADATESKRKPGRPKKERHRCLDLLEDFEHLAEQLGQARQPGIIGWAPKARRNIAPRLGVTKSALDRAIFRARAA